MDRVPAERLAQPEPSGHRALEHDAERRDDHEPEREAGKDPEEARSELRCCRTKNDRRRDRTADDEQDEREVERADELEECVDRAWGLRAEDLLARTARRSLLDVEYEGAGDRVRVGRDDPPRDRVRPARELSVDLDGDRVLARPDDLARVDASASTVVDADRAERRLDRLVEAQRHGLRARSDDRVVAR